MAPRALFASSSLEFHGSGQCAIPLDLGTRLNHLVHHKRETCRVCGGTDLRQFLCLGSTPLANSFLRAPEEFADESCFPLALYYCGDCSLVQLLDVIDPEVLFKNYIYVTGTSTTIRAHNVEYSRTVVDLLKNRQGDLIVEVASNDGSLLKCFKPYQMRTLGVEPAANIAQLARDDGVQTINQFFNYRTSEMIRRTYGPAKAVIANNVLAHVDEPVDFLRGCKHLIDDGLVIVEVPYLRELIDRTEYDTVYHEHLSYFSITALQRLCEKAELSLVRVDRVAVHGGSLRIYAGSPQHYGGHHLDVIALVDAERDAGLSTFERYEHFAQAVQSNRRALRELLRDLRCQGKTIAAYGAPAKGNTLLNYCDIGRDLIAYTVDKNPMKVGLYTPGMHLPVMHVSEIIKDKPDFVLVLAWNFADEIMQQQQAFRDIGGKFIIPIPEPRII